MARNPEERRFKPSFRDLGGEPVEIEAGLSLVDGLGFEIRLLDERGRIVDVLRHEPKRTYEEALAMVEHFRRRHGGRDRIPYEPETARRLAA